MAKKKNMYGKFYSLRRYVERGFSQLCEKMAPEIFQGLDTNSRILEICCGQDYLFDHMPDWVKEQYGPNWIHTDILAGVIEQNKKRHPERPYEVRDVRNLGIEPSSIDVVLCLTAMDLFGPQHLDEAVSEVHDVLRPGGIFYICLT